MDVFLMIRRKKSTIFTDCKDTSTIKDLKKIIEGIMKVAPENQRLTDEGGNEVYEDSQTLQQCNLNPQSARAHTPASIVLTFRGEDGEFEPMSIHPLSSPPELPEVMRQETGMHE